MSRNPEAAAGPPGWLLVIYTVLAIAGLVAVGRFVLRPLFRGIGNLGEREMFVFAALFTVIAAAALMEWLGLSTALGAFVAGVMLADSPYRHELETDVEPFRSILLGLFFLAVGMMLDLTAIAERPLFVLAMAAALIATKTLVIFLIGLAFRMPWRGALALGLGVVAVERGGGEASASRATTVETGSARFSICGSGKRIGPAETGQVEADHPVLIGQSLVLLVPVVEAAADAVQQHQHRHDDDPQGGCLGRREVDLVGQGERDHRREHQHDDRDRIGHDPRAARAEGPLVGHGELRSGTRGCR
jgi:hypothetical protein